MKSPQGGLGTIEEAITTKPDHYAVFLLSKVGILSVSHPPM